MKSAKSYILENKQRFIDELHRVIAHGLLHLIGYNDKTEKESKIMRLNIKIIR